MLTASALLGIALKSFIIAGSTLGLLRLVRNRTPAERSLIAHLGLLVLLLLPLASLLLPQWAPLPQSLSTAGEQIRPLAVEVPTLAAANAQPMVEPAMPAPALPSFALPTLPELALWLYALPLGLLVAAMAVAVIRLLGMRRNAEVLVNRAWLAALAEAQRRMGFKHGTALLVSDELRSPISWGVLRPTILLNPQAVSAVSDAEAIIAHELAHVARLDWAKLLLARTTCALLWFNPLVWLLARESHHLREEAADDAVLLTDIAGTDYAALLVNAARHDNNAVLLAAHGVAPARNSLRRRVERVLDGDARRGAVQTRWAALSLVAVLGATAPLAAFSTEVPVDTQPSRSVATELAGNTGSGPVIRATPVIPAARAAAGQEATEGRTPLSAEDLVGMRAVGVTPADVAQMREAQDDIDADEIIAVKATGVSPHYIAEMRAVLGRVDASDLMGARAVGVDAAFARAMRAVDPDADLDEIIGARAVGVSPAYAQAIRAHFPRATLDDLVSMRATGVTGAYIREMRAAGLNVGNPDDVVGMRAVTSRPGPPPAPPRPPRAGSGPEASAVVLPSGMVATSRAGENAAEAVILRGPPGDD